MPSRFSSSLSLVAAIIALATSGALRAEEGDLSHEALFAPNKTFPYFESCGELYPNPPSVFDARNAAFLAQCSMLIYVKEPDFIEETLANAGFPKVRFFEAEGTYAFLAENETQRVLVFRGTETGDRVDYWTDAQILQIDFGPIAKGKAHAGFARALQAVFLDIEAAASERESSSDASASEKKRFWVAGHSLGAALATLFAIQSPDRLEAVYAIGSPRCLNAKLAKHAEKSLPVYRVINDNDIVPRVPARPLYRHVGSSYLITSDRELLVDPPMLEKWEQRFRGHKAYLKTLFEENWSRSDFNAIPSDSFADHSPRLYVEALIALSQQGDADG
ncbi:lipase family protein [Pelagicoccus sp. SDUM812003]|uniref:lipase family protein n=1 Tax=Pelagicoccus sp. SDUM812003 TaxID=3041267 RepID=UPI00280C6D8D|nr:lipase family protein [Pelagicoccus sp. SDUM812003]MDQ8201901.1 lipase family protein [Pelagicoccus sp. SDUM812003]